MIWVRPRAGTAIFIEPALNPLLGDATIEDRDESCRAFTRIPTPPSPLSKTDVLRFNSHPRNGFVKPYADCIAKSPFSCWRKKASQKVPLQYWLRAFTGCSFVPSGRVRKGKKKAVLFPQYSDQNSQGFHQEQSFYPCGLLTP